MASSLPDSTTWTGKRDGAPWESHGTSMEWYYQPVWLLETRNVPGIGSWTDHTSKMLRLKTKRGVRSWWGGTMPGLASFTLEQHDAEMTIGVSAEIRLSVSVPSGVVPVFWGRVQRITEQLTANRYATYTISCVDAFGTLAQATVGPVTGSPNAFTSDALRAILAPYVSTVGISGITTAQGYSTDTNYAASNLMDVVNQIVRGGLGVLWVDALSNAQYRSFNWWWPVPATTVAALGPVSDTPGKTATYRVDYSKASPEGNVMEVKNSVTWSGPFPAGSYTISTGVTPIVLYGERVYSDTIRGTSNAAVNALLTAFQSALGYTGTAVPISTKTVRFPADLSEDASEYAAAAEVTDYVEVAKASLVNSWSSWEHYHHVMSIQHEWSPATGWFCTLGLTDNTPNEEIEW